MLHVGIDFSISSPCVCFWNSSQEHLFENCEFFFLHSRNLIEKISFPSNISLLFITRYKQHDSFFNECWTSCG